jgi:hypothetical protein
MEQKLDLILTKLNSLEKDVAYIKSKFDEGLSDDCKKMSEHIDFVENVYENVKNPLLKLGFLCNKLNVFSGYNTEHTLVNAQLIQNQEECSDD